MKKKQVKFLTVGIYIYIYRERERERDYLSFVYLIYLTWIELNTRQKHKEHKTDSKIMNNRHNKLDKNVYENK